MTHVSHIIHSWSQLSYTHAYLSIEVIQHPQADLGLTFNRTNTRSWNVRDRLTSSEYIFTPLISDSSGFWFYDRWIFPGWFQLNRMNPTIPYIFKISMKERLLFNSIFIVQFSFILISWDILLSSVLSCIDNDVVLV